MANRRVLYSDIVHCGYEAVDLGLPSGLLWATCNIGAHSPEEVGLYFAWGEIQGYSSEDIEIYKLQILDGTEYKWKNHKDNSLTKYCTDSQYGTVDNKTTLEPEDDAAYMLMGKNWRIPTKDDYQELIDLCDTRFTQMNGINGMLFTLKTDINKSIFFPITGFGTGFIIDWYGNDGWYWTSSLYTNINKISYQMSFENSDNVTLNNTLWSMTRENGLPIRAVLDLSK